LGTGSERKGNGGIRPADANAGGPPGSITVATTAIGATTRFALVIVGMVRSASWRLLHQTLRDQHTPVIRYRGKWHEA
jgi:hypothetical protein